MAHSKLKLKSKFNSKLKSKLKSKSQSKSKLNKTANILSVLHKASPTWRKSLIKDAPKEVINCLSESCYNVLKGNVPLSQHQKHTLSSKRQHIRALASKSVALKKKKKILGQYGGGFLGPLLGALIPTVLGLAKKL